MIPIAYFISSFNWTPGAVVLIGSAPLLVQAVTVGRLSTIALPNGDVIYERLAAACNGVYAGLVCFLFDNTSGIEVVWHGDAIPDQKENVICISNHQSTTDWIVASMLATRQGQQNHVRHFLKDGLKYIPLYGWLLRQHGCLFVKRRAEVDGAVIRRSLQGFVRRQTPLWLVIYPEGTRYDISKPHLLKQSQTFAQERGLPPLNQVLTPRTKGVEVCVHELQHHCQAVYDITIAYTPRCVSSGTRHPAPSMCDFLSGRFRRVNIHLRRIPMENVPVEEDLLRRWVMQRFEQKDRLLEEFFSTGKMEDDGRCEPLPLRVTLPPTIFFSIHLALAVCNPTARLAYLTTLVAGSVLPLIYASLCH